MKKLTAKDVRHWGIWLGHKNKKEKVAIIKEIKKWDTLDATGTNNIPSDADTFDTIYFLQSGDMISMWSLTVGTQDAFESMYSDLLEESDSEPDIETVREVAEETERDLYKQIEKLTNEVLGGNLERNGMKNEIAELERVIVSLQRPKSLQEQLNQLKSTIG